MPVQVRSLAQKKKARKCLFLRAMKIRRIFKDLNDGAIPTLAKVGRESVPSPKTCDDKFERRGKDSGRSRIEKEPEKSGSFSVDGFDCGTVI